MSEFKLGIGRISPLTVNIDYDTVKVPMPILRIIHHYVNNHREDILDKMNDFGYLGAVLVWFDHQERVKAEPVTVVESPVTWTGDNDEMPAIEACDDCGCFHGAHNINCPSLPGRPKDLVDNNISEGAL